MRNNALFEDIVPFNKATTVILFDMANIVYRMAVQKDLAQLRTSFGQPSGYIYGFDKAVQRAFGDYHGPATSIVFGWDTAGSKNIRQEIYPEYKANRKDRKDMFQEYFNMSKSQVFKEIREFSNTFPHHTLQSNDVEFDDLAADLIIAHPNKQFFMLSNDKDLWQLLVHDNLNIIGSMGAVVGRSELDKAFELTNFSQVFIYKALFGDPSDNIASVLPRVIKKPIIEEVIKPLTKSRTKPVLDPDLITATLAASSSKRAKELIKETDFKDRLYRNMILVGFMAVNASSEMSEFVPGDYDLYEKACDHYQLNQRKASGTRMGDGSMDYEIDATKTWGL